ncbi:MAG TPA: YdjY domain-containing protein [Thermoanaerobaculia bacterium]
MRTLLALWLFTLAATPAVDRARKEVRFTATVQPGAMSRPFGVQGHHAIVWKGGRSKTWALFVADVSDRDVRRALDSIGAKRGENLTPASWNERENPRSPEPDKRVVGTPIDVFVEWNGSRGRIPLSRLVEEEGHASPLLDFRYGGNEAYQKEFRSGCIVCLYSCPGGAIGNHAHPIRDYVRDGVVYSSAAERLPKGGTKVTITLAIRE